MMEKDLNYYLNLPYTVILEQEEDNDGSMCYVARLLELPHCIGVGKTTEEAFNELDLHKKMVIEGYYEDGVLLPEPQNCSGNLNIRIDPVLHARLAHEAAAYEMSLNKYASLILERRQLAAPVGNTSVIKETKNRYSARKKSK
jgi:antitoxin HicB